MLMSTISFRIRNTLISCCLGVLLLYGVTLIAGDFSDHRLSCSGVEQDRTFVATIDSQSFFTRPALESYLLSLPAHSVVRWNLEFGHGGPANLEQEDLYQYWKKLRALCREHQLLWRGSVMIF
jgi:hypothetical protein